jgi:hypothetical protein
VTDTSPDVDEHGQRPTRGRLRRQASLEARGERTVHRIRQNSHFLHTRRNADADRRCAASGRRNASPRLPRRKTVAFRSRGERARRFHDMARDGVAPRARACRGRSRVPDLDGLPPYQTENARSSRRVAKSSVISAHPIRQFPSTLLPSPLSGCRRREHREDEKQPHDRMHAGVRSHFVTSSR